MNETGHVDRRTGWRRLGWALAFMALGAGIATAALRFGPAGLRGSAARPESKSVAASAPAPTSAPAPGARGGAADTGDTEIVVPADQVARAGLKTVAVTTAESGAKAQMPGTVMPNAYREVKVTPIAGGIVTAVHVELGATVRRGQPLAVIRSPELADAQMRYLSMAAMLEADHRKLERTERLTAIGAASRQELDEVTATHRAHESESAAARQRLLVLGLTETQVDALKSASQVVSQITVPVPIDGVITGRATNLGQVVTMGQELFVVTDLSDVWVVGDLYEQDFAGVRVGAEATVMAPAYPGTTFRGRVSYIDPRVDPQTRTAKVRVQLPNADGRLRLGMYVTIAFATPGERRVLVPREAVQSLGDRQVVFLPVANEEGKFIRRVVRLGALAGDSYAVLSGIRAGDRVVTEGSFLLRAESTRNTGG